MINFFSSPKSLQKRLAVTSAAGKKQAALEAAGTQQIAERRREKGHLMTILIRSGHMRHYCAGRGYSVGETWVRGKP